MSRFVYGSRYDPLKGLMRIDAWTPEYAESVYRGERYKRGTPGTGWMATTIGPPDAPTPSLKFRPVGRF